MASSVEINDCIFATKSLTMKQKSDASYSLLCCRKEIIGRNYIKQRCGWTGVLSELVTHIQSEHKENFFCADTGKLMFKWQLPSYADQEDLGIIRVSSVYLLYSLFYSEKTKELTVTVWNMSGTDDKLYYQTTLLHNHKSKPYMGKVNDVQHINDDQYVPSKIILQSDDIEQYCDEYKIFKFSLRIF